MAVNVEDKLLRSLTRALRRYRLIENDDHVLVALSGGKDSLCLLELLARRCRIYPPRFKLSAVHVRMTNIAYETDTAYLGDFCNRLGVPLYVLTTGFEVSSPNGMSGGSEELSQSGSRKQKTPCFLCSWNRRKQIFQLAQQIGCSKIALGHHQDDILHTALMNLAFQGRFGSMPVYLNMEKMPLAIIRPLCLCREDDIKVLANEHGYRPQKTLCPYDQETHRASIRNVYDHMQQLNPEFRYSLWHALERDGKLLEG